MWRRLLNTRLVIVLSFRYSKCEADTLSVLSSCFDERCEAKAHSVLAGEITENTSVTESSFASPPHAKRRVQLSFTERFEILGGDSLELNKIYIYIYQDYIYGSEICC